MLINDPNQVTPPWLTQVLGRKGLLLQGDVDAVEIVAPASRAGVSADVARLAIRYSADATGDLPTRLFLKMSRADVHAEVLAYGNTEVAFYNAMANVPEMFSIPRCYDAFVDPETGHSHILMDDLSETHFQKPFPIPPSGEHSVLLVESLAQLHAFWWDDPRLGNEIGRPFDPDIAHASRVRLEETFPKFIDLLGESLLPEQVKIYERILGSDVLQRRQRRYEQMDRVTLAHGDAHPANFMLPHDTDRDSVVIIDWQLSGVDIAAGDLAFMMAHRWPPQRRAALEKTLLQHYHDRLLAHGVGGYSWDDLWRDYREAVIVTALIPIGQYRRDLNLGVIWMGIEHSMAAFEDLQCIELL